MKRGILFAKILIVVIALILGIYKYTKLKENKLTTIKIGVTAEIMLTVDSDDSDNIKKVDINNDAANVYNEEMLKGKKLEEGLEVIINEAKKNGYLFDYQDVKVTVISNDQDKIDKYTQICQNCINNMQSDLNVATIEPTEDEIDIYSGESQTTLKAKYTTSSVEEMGRIIYTQLEDYIKGEQNSKGKWVRQPITEENKDIKSFNIYNINIETSNPKGVYVKPESYYYIKDSKVYLYIEVELFVTSQKDDKMITTKELHKIFYNGSKDSITKHDVKVYEYTNTDNQNQVVNQ